MVKIIVKYLANEASLEEMNVLSLWLEIEENLEFFKDFVLVNLLVDSALSKYDCANLKKEISKRM